MKLSDMTREEAAIRRLYIARRALKAAKKADADAHAKYGSCKSDPGNNRCFEELSPEEYCQSCAGTQATYEARIAAAKESAAALRAVTHIGKGLASEAF